MIDNVFVIILADGRIDRHGNGADLHDSHVQHVPFRTVAGNDAHLVARLNAEFDERIAEVIGDLLVLLRGIGDPTFGFLVCQRHFLVWKCFRIVRQNVEQTCNVTRVARKWFLFFTHVKILMVYSFRFEAAKEALLPHLRKKMWLWQAEWGENRHSGVKNDILG